LVRVVFLSQFYDIIKNGKKEYLGEKAEKTPFKTIKKLYESSKCYVIWGHNLLKKTVKTAKNCRNTYLTEILTQQKYLPNRNTYPTEILTQQKYLPNRNTYPTEILTQQKYLPNRNTYLTEILT
jgi:hypothetical protein